MSANTSRSLVSSVGICGLQKMMKMALLLLLHSLIVTTTAFQQPIVPTTSLNVEKLQVFSNYFDDESQKCTRITTTTTTTTSLYASGRGRGRGGGSGRCRAGVVANLYDADFVEQFVGGERYEMVPLPDSMVDTTLFVGNLNEFVYDSDLSDLFQSVSFLNTLPACVARKPNMDSLHYGFVTFPTVEEKEAAIIRFHGSLLKGQSLRVEPIRDHPKIGRVRVPERMVSYVSGEAKKTRDGRVNTLRRISRLENKMKQKKIKKKNKKNDGGNKRKNKQQRLTSLINKLGQVQQKEFYRATRKGFITLSGTGYRRGRKACLLACAHRQWCEEHCKPQVILCKASGGRPLDNVIVDLSTIRPSIQSMKTNDDDDYNDEEIHDDDVPMTIDDVLSKHKVQIITAASTSGMILRQDYVEDNCVTLSSPDSYNVDGEVITSESLQEKDKDTDNNVYSWERKPISRLPTLSMGVFEGERVQAKAMVRDLATLWDIPDEGVDMNMNGNDNEDFFFNDKKKNGNGGGGGKRHQNKRRGGGGSDKDDRRRNNRRNNNRRRQNDEEMMFFY